MALRDWILDSGKVATATLAIVATPATEEGRTIASVATVAVAREEKTEIPAWCRADCPCLEIIEGVGPGCVRNLETGPWKQEWKRIPVDLANCRKKKIMVH